MRAVNDLCRQSSVGNFEFEETVHQRSTASCLENLAVDDLKVMSAVEAVGMEVWRYRLYAGASVLPVWIAWPKDPFHAITDENECKFGVETLNEFFSRTGITSEDLWHETDVRRFSTARIFPVASAKDEENEASRLFLWLFAPNSDIVSQTKVDAWRCFKRVSLEDLIDSLNLYGEFSLRRRIAVAKAKQRIEAVLSVPTGSSPMCDTGLRPLLRWLVCINEARSVLPFLDQLAVQLHNDPGQVARILATIADLLGAMACKRGGLRSGPALNRDWINAFEAFKSSGIVSGVEMLAKERCHWLNTPDRLIRAARHYEKASQTLISEAVMTAKEQIHAIRKSELCGGFTEVLVECPARIDIAGGWSDTPPLCYENGGTVINMSVSVNSELPIGARVQRIEEPIFRIKTSAIECVIASKDDLVDFNNPTSPGALIKATLVFTNMTPPLKTADGTAFGLHISTWSTLPYGSGLGTSSIMCAGLLTALWTMKGCTFTELDVTHGVLIIEQLMTTGGGWQDQIGGIGKGLQMGFSAKGLPLSVGMETLVLEDDVIRQLNSRLVLLYSGKTRLAKNLLQDVIRNWYARDAVISKNVEDLVSNALKCRDALLTGNLTEVSHCLKRYWIQKKIMAPGCEPLLITKLMDTLQPHMSSMSLAGAGGGGFLVGLLEPNTTRESVIEKIDGLKEVISDLELYDCEIHKGGMRIITKP